MSAEEVTKIKKPRNFTHVPFDRMTCPVPGCKQLNGGPEEGTVPGMKRHARKRHTQAEYDAVVWPPIRANEVLSSQAPTSYTVPDDASSLEDAISELHSVI